MSDLLEHVPLILNFGFLGLSFLMVLLGFLLVSKAISQQLDPGRIALTKFFLKIAMVFMLLAGPLQWITTWISDRPIELSISANNPDWEEGYGKVYVELKDGDLRTITEAAFKERFFDQDPIRIDLSKVVQAFRDNREAINILNTQLNSDSQEVRETLAGG